MMTNHPLSQHKTSHTRHARISWIDILRGIAIMLMIPANLSPVWNEPTQWFRVVASYPAPTFIMLSTGMVILNAQKYSFKYFLQRGLIVVGFAAFVDIFGACIFPFTAFDVLYLIGVSLPIIYLAHHFNTVKLMTTCFMIIVASVILQNLVGYHESLLDITWANRQWPGLLRVLQSWFIDGWFPIFPWLGVVFFGAALFKIIFKQPDHVISKKIIVISCIAILVGFILLFIPTHLYNNVSNHGILTRRDGYSEIFYPATPAYLLTAFGIVTLLTKVAQYLANFKFSKLLSLFGRFSLLIYILHQAIRAYVIEPIMNVYGIKSIINGFWFAVVVVLTIVGIYLICLLIEKWKQHRVISSVILTMLIGK